MAPLDNEPGTDHADPELDLGVDRATALTPLEELQALRRTVNRARVNVDEIALLNHAHGVRVQRRQVSNEAPEPSRACNRVVDGTVDHDDAFVERFTGRARLPQQAATVSVVAAQDIDVGSSGADRVDWGE